jgi:Vitamin B12 dependent methionine synthase, activation domain
MGLSADETLPPHALIGEKYRGIRPAPGYRPHRQSVAVLGLGLIEDVLDHPAAAERGGVSWVTLSSARKNTRTAARHGA